MATILLQSQNWMTFTVLAAFIGAAASLATLFIKEVFIENSKAKKAKDALYQNHITYLALATRDLLSAFLQICEDFPPDYLDKEMLKLKIDMRTNDSKDPHYKKYKFVRTLYRQSAFFAWLEINRLDVSFLESSSGTNNQTLKRKIEEIRNVFAEGRLNYNRNWRRWNDYLIFTEEQRAIGEGMIEFNEGKFLVMGFGKFQDMIENYLLDNKPMWLEPLILFMDNTEIKDQEGNARPDFRKERFLYLIKCFDDLLKIIGHSEFTDIQMEVKKLFRTSEVDEIIKKVEERNLTFMGA